MYKLLPFFKDSPAHLSEISQAKTVKMAFCTELNGELTRCHEFVKCRDFLGDVLVYEYEGRNELIYGFTFNDSNPRIDKSRLSLLIQFPTKTNAKLFKNNLWLLGEYEKANHCQPTVVHSTEDPKVLWLTADKFWQKNIPIISFFTYLLKCMAYKVPKLTCWKNYIKGTRYGKQPYKSRTPEAEYMDNVGPEKLDFFGKNCYDIFHSTTDVSGWETQETLYNIHNKSGFVSIIQWGNQSNNKLAKVYNNYVEQHQATNGTVPA